MSICVAMAKSLWDKILIRVASNFDTSDGNPSPRAVENPLFACANCKELIATDSTVYMAYDRAYCKESCRVLAVVPPGVRDQVITKAAAIGLKVPSNDALKSQ